jgi:hypothetical protein
MDLKSMAYSVWVQVPPWEFPVSSMVEQWSFKPGIQVRFLYGGRRFSLMVEFLVVDQKGVGSTPTVVIGGVIR